MDIRQATEEDLVTILQMAIKFIENSSYRAYYTPVQLGRLIASFLQDEDKILLLADDVGFLAGMVTPFIFGERKIATELGWWVEPEYRNKNIGKQLLDAFESWAKEQGCELITMVGLDDSLDKFYSKAGYKLTERAYIKEV